MQEKDIRAAAERITLPQTARERMERKLMQEERRMKDHKTRFVLSKPMTVAAVLVLCLVLSVTTLAATGALHGCFQDVKNLGGAVVGTTYEQATEEIRVQAAVKDGKLVVTATFADVENPPFLAETLRISAYRVMDAEGKVLHKGTTQAAALDGGQAEFLLDLAGATGAQELIVTEFIAESKADRPMPVRGSWVCAID